MPDVGPIELLSVIIIAAMYLMIPVGIVLLVVRRLRRRSDPALDALRARFAAGEIDETEYVRRRSMLLGD